MILDWALASLHHLAFLALAAIIAFELALTAGEVRGITIARLSRIDAWYGVMAAVVLAVGFARVEFGAKGHEYYFVNTFFWIKMALFAAIGLISIAPTMRYFAWRRAARLDASFSPDPSAVSAVRRALWAEVVLFLLMPIAAAAMARGFGM